MDNSENTQQVEQSSNDKNSGPLIIIIVTVIVVIIALWQFSVDDSASQQPIQEVSTTAEVEVIQPEQIEPDVVQELIEPTDIVMEEVEPITPEDTAIKTPEIDLPKINESDEWIQAKLPDLTWRNELLSLLVTEDMIRRFVVFTDNFAQGLLAYDHSLFIKPKETFSVDEKSLNVTGEKNVWQWDSKTSQRFDLYVDLLRSVDSTTLVNMYIDIKPLVDQAYNELGYEDDFTYTLQDAITRVLDMDLPQSTMNVTRSSVMYKYQDPELEKLADSDKLLLRIGKENLLIIKSVLLEVNEKLNKRLAK
ncbi:DUF3014 domain-containing protein [Colwellia sp. E2M01]|uniref:DUF3014 domain-containing protein n=1 Tax=Colwellia sp. E2M01 TaxID=2841561 RepID=UPI001C093A94|nr:DUF3014 domain-containing protein [Colwellia sp. E2M01]MBU2870767.1 DUF3014 domain-containing protein [Colwellia sp. E2M01]